MAAAFMASSIVLNFLKTVSRFILDSLNYFPGTTVSSTSSTTPPNGIYSFCTNSATSDVSVWTSLIYDASIE